MYLFCFFGKLYYTIIFYFIKAFISTLMMNIKRYILNIVVDYQQFCGQKLSFAAVVPQKGINKNYVNKIFLSR